MKVQSTANLSSRGTPEVIRDVSGIDIMTHGACARAVDRVICAAHRLGRRPDVMKNLRAAHATIEIIPRSGNLTDLPAFRHLAGQKTLDGREWSTVPGLTELKNGRVMAAVRESDLVDLERYDVAVHELGHMIKYVGVTAEERTDIQREYQKRPVAKAVDAYAALNEDEWFANGTAAWFGASNANVLVGDAWFEQNGSPHAQALMRSIYGNATGLPQLPPAQLSGVELSAGTASLAVITQVEKAARVTGSRADIQRRLEANQVTLVLSDEDKGLGGLPETSEMPSLVVGASRVPAQRLSDGRLACLASPTETSAFERAFWTLATAVYRVGITDEERDRVKTLRAQNVGVGTYVSTGRAQPELYFADLAVQWSNPRTRKAMRKQVPGLALLLSEIYPALGRGPGGLFNLNAVFANLGRSW